MLEIQKENIKSSFEFLKKIAVADYDLVPSRGSYKKVFLLVSVLLFFSGLTFIVNSIEKYNTISGTGIVLFILMAVFLCIFIFYKNIIVKKNAERAFLSQGTNRFLMNDEGIRGFRPQTENSVLAESNLTKWTDMIGYYHKDDFILLYGKVNGFIFFDLNNYTQEEQKVLLGWIKASVAPVQVVINAAVELEKQKNSGANAFIAPPGKNSTIMIIIFSALILISIIVSYLKYFVIK